jgi:large subunit ribosomal protein L17
MKKNVFGRQFKRDSNERKALFKNLLTSLVLEDHIRTTQEKAKAIKGAADKLVTKAKKGGTEAYRALAPDVNHSAVVKLVTDIAPRFATRQGGYTRSIKVGRRVADNAAMVLMEWVEKPVVTEKTEKSAEKEKKTKKVVKTDKKVASTVSTKKSTETKKEPKVKKESKSKK